VTESPVDRLLATLDLQEVGAVEVNLRPTDQTPAELPALVNEDVTVFLGQSERMPHHRVFGGQVLAQGVIACGRTITLEPGAPPRPIHSLHAYFMRPGDDEAPIHFAVERMRDGASFSTRRMHAIQHGKPILAMSASFQEVAGGLDHQDEMPTVPAPEDLPSMTDLFGGINEPRAQDLANRRPIDMRHNHGHLFFAPAEERTAEQSVWMRTKGALPDDPLIHAAVLAYSSDYSLLEPVLRRHGLVWPDARLRIASLDHAMWFHRQARADDWVLYAQQSPSAQSGRGLAIGRMFGRDGTMIATVAQEGMIRVKE